MILRFHPNTTPNSVSLMYMSPEGFIEELKSLPEVAHYVTNNISPLIVQGAIALPVTRDPAGIFNHSESVSSFRLTEGYVDDYVVEIMYRMLHYELYGDPRDGGFVRYKCLVYECNFVTNEGVVL